MIITLSLNNYRDTGHTVEFRDSASNTSMGLYSSLSRKLALQEYYDTRRRIDNNSFKIIDSVDNALNTSTTYECLLQFVLFKEGDLK